MRKYDERRRKLLEFIASGPIRSGDLRITGIQQPAVMGDYPAAEALLKDATASSGLSNMSNTVTSRVMRRASFM